MALGRRLFRAAGGDASAVPNAERRRSVRHITVLQVAKLCSGAGEELCLLRDVSEDGLKAEIYGPVSDGETVTIELRTGHSVSGRVAWIERPMIGIQFPAPVPILSMLAHCTFDERLTKLRPPRINTDLPATLNSWDEVLDVRVTNLSQAGLRVFVGKPLEGDTDCDILLPSLAKRGAKIRWSHQGECGLQLDQPLAYREFAAWRTLLLAATAAGGGTLAKQAGPLRWPGGAAGGYRAAGTPR